MRKPIGCMLGRHHNVWKSNPDGDRYKQCSRCGRDDPGAAITVGWYLRFPSQPPGPEAWRSQTLSPGNQRPSPAETTHSHAADECVTFAAKPRHPVRSTEIGLPIRSRPYQPGISKSGALRSASRR